MKQLRKTFMEKKKNNKNFNRFLLLWSGELVSAIGGGLTSFGLGVYIFQQTGSAADMALVTLLAFLPTLLLSVPAGVLADRYDRRLLMMLGVAETVCACGMLVTGLFLGMRGIKKGYVRIFCKCIMGNWIKKNCRHLSENRKQFGSIRC